MINYNYYDLYMYDEYCNILEYLEGTIPDDEEVWDIARESTEIPIFEDIAYDLVLSRIKDKLESTYDDIDVTYYINSRDTHLYINTKEVYNFDTFKAIIEEMK